MKNGYLMTHTVDSQLSLKQLSVILGLVSPISGFCSALNSPHQTILVTTIRDLIDQSAH